MTSILKKVCRVAIVSGFYALVLTSSSQASATAATSDFQTGVKEYRASNFALAAVYLKRAAAEEPNDSTVHYYYANTLASLHDVAQAITEYHTCLRRHPSQLVSEYATAALVAYGADIPVQQAQFPEYAAANLPVA